MANGAYVHPSSFDVVDYLATFGGAAALILTVYILLKLFGVL